MEPSAEPILKPRCIGFESFNDAVAKATIDLALTYTNKFVEAAASRA